MPGLDPSIYNNLTAPPSPIDTISKYTGIQNSLVQNQLLRTEIPIRQQQQQQAAMETMRQQGEIDSMKYLGDPQWNEPDGISKNWNGMLADAAVKSPLAVPSIMAKRDAYLTPADAGVNPATGAPQSAPLQEVLAHGQTPPPQGGGTTTQQSNAASANNQPAAPANSNFAHPMQTGLAPGVEQNIKSYQDEFQNTQQAANDANVKKAALSNVYDLSKSGAPSGQKVGAFYSLLTQYGLAPAGAQTSAEQLQLIKDHAAQIATASGSRSDQDLLAHQLANVNEDDLPAVMQKMIPYLQGVEDAKISKAAYYRQQDPTGSNPQKIQAAQGFWQQHADPRIWELKELQKSDPDSFKDRAKGLQPSEAAELAQHSKALHSAGAIGQ